MFTRVEAYDWRGIELESRMIPIAAAHLGRTPKAGVTGSTRGGRRPTTGRPQGGLSCRARQSFQRVTWFWGNRRSALWPPRDHVV